MLTMHCMFLDVKAKFQDSRNRKTFQGIDFNEILFADDALIISKSARLAARYLHLIEQESSYLHLKRNKDKCACISYNSQGTVYFSNGQRMKASDEVKYLGISVTQKIDPKHEIRKQISATMAVLKKLDIVG